MCKSLFEIGKPFAALSMHQFKLKYLETEKFAIGHFVSSGDIFAGGHLWRINCYPRGDTEKHNGDYVSIYLQHESKSEGVKVIFKAFVMHKVGTPTPSSSSYHRRLELVFAPKGSGIYNQGGLALWNEASSSRSA